MIFGCDAIHYGDLRYIPLYFYILPYKLWLILPEATAIGMRLSHASQGALRSTGVRLSNMWVTYPQVGDNLGKLRLISHR